MSLFQTRHFITILLTIGLIAGCQGSTPNPTQVPAAPPQPTATIIPAPEPVQLHGDIAVSNQALIELYYQQRFVYLQDLTGFVNRDYGYQQPLEGQILGPIETHPEYGTLSYTISLPAQPTAPLNTFGSSPSGVAVWQVVMQSNTQDDPFLQPGETIGWSAPFSSTRLGTGDEISGGHLLVWAPDANQQFPTGYGPDRLLFTADDPVGPLPAGYSVVNIESAPFVVIREQTPEVDLFEAQPPITDLRAEGWPTAFQEMAIQAERAYPFTDLNGVNWNSLTGETTAQIAEANGDGNPYFAALRDFTQQIPDGNIQLQGTDYDAFARETVGGYGFGITQLDDERVVVSVVLPGSPAAEEGITVGTEIVQWDGLPIDEALAAVQIPVGTFSTEHVEQIQRLRYLVRDPIETEVEIRYRNPGEGTRITTLTAFNDDRAIFQLTSTLAGFNPSALPIEHRLLESGYGYIRINSFARETFLTLRLWEEAVRGFAAADVPGIVIDLRQNAGGADLGATLAGAFADGRPFEISQSYRYSEQTGHFEPFGPPTTITPNPDLDYDGQIAVLVGPACASTCEAAVYAFSQLEQVTTVGQHPTNGTYGIVEGGTYLLPPPGQDQPPYTMTFPTGMVQNMEGDIIIQGSGITPDVTVPRTDETLQAEAVEGRDVVLEAAVERLRLPPGAGVAPTGSPDFDSDFGLRQFIQTGASFIEEYATERYPPEELYQAGETYIFTVGLGISREMVWSYLWCAVDQNTLEQNWEQISFRFTLNGEEIPAEEFSVTSLTTTAGRCRVIYGLLAHWPDGEHYLTTEITFAEEIDTGEATYPTGTHIFEYRVFIDP